MDGILISHCLNEQHHNKTWRCRYRQCYQSANICLKVFDLKSFSGLDRGSCFVDLRNRVSTMPYHFYYLYSSSQVIEQNRIEPYMIRIQAKKPLGCLSIWSGVKLWGHNSWRLFSVAYVKVRTWRNCFITKPNVWMASPDSGFSTPVSCINCCVVVDVVVVPPTTAIIKPFPRMRSALRRKEITQRILYGYVVTRNFSLSAERCFKSKSERRYPR